jgi:hypothetical protein
MTSIEWLIEEMLSKGFFKESVTLTNIDHLQYKAEEMHKQEIIDAYEQGSDDEIVAYDGTRKYKHGLEYYTYTYVSKGSDVSEKPNNHIDAQLPQQEISDEEIYKGIINVCSIPHDRLDAEINAMIEGAKWYREQLKSK